MGERGSSMFSLPASAKSAENEGRSALPGIRGCVSLLLFNCVNVGLPFEFGASSVVVWSSTKPVASFRGRPFFGLMASDEFGSK